MDRRRLPRTYHQPVPEPIELTPADLHAARVELAVALLAPLLETQPPLPGPLRQRLAPMVGQLQGLIQGLRQAEARRPPGRG
jgi:uncharacterized membrane protein YccC